MRGGNTATLNASIKINIFSFSQLYHGFLVSTFHTCNQTLLSVLCIALNGIINCSYTINRHTICTFNSVLDLNFIGLLIHHK